MRSTKFKKAISCLYCLLQIVGIHLLIQPSFAETPFAYIDAGKGTLSVVSSNGTKSTVLSDLRVPFTLTRQDCTLYWTEEARGELLYKTPLNGSFLRTIADQNVSILAFGTNGTRAAIQALTGNTQSELVWGSYGALGKLTPSNLNGAGVSETFPFESGVGVVRALTIDSANGKIYWLDSGTYQPIKGFNESSRTTRTNNQIRRANLDGSAVELLVAEVHSEAVSVDFTHGHIYYADNFSAPGIHRTDLNGSNPTIILSGHGLNYISDLVVDPVGQRLIWIDLGTGKIQRSTLNGSSIEDVVTDVFYGHGMTLLPYDTDTDGTDDCNDSCPADSLKITPGTCGCGTADTDTDGDGTPNCNDTCPSDPLKTTPGTCGCGTADTDTDNDGTPNCNDTCPSDPLKITPGTCGCGTIDTDTDSDGTPNCNDTCPSDPLKITPGTCGCGTLDIDGDNDGVFDCQDECPADPAKHQRGMCGCGVGEQDSDSDGIPNCVDECSQDPNKTEKGRCGCGVPDIDQDQDGIIDCAQVKKGVVPDSPTTEKDDRGKPILKLPKFDENVEYVITLVPSKKNGELRPVTLKTKKQEVPLKRLPPGSWKVQVTVVSRQGGKKVTTKKSKAIAIKIAAKNSKKKRKS